MKLIDIIATSSSNMFRSKLRTILTVIAIFIGAFTLTLTNGLGQGISKYIDKQVSNLGAEDVFIIQGMNDQTGLPSDVPKKYDPNKRTTSIESEGNRTVTVFTEKDLEKIRAIPGIKSAAPYASAPIDYITGTSNDKYIASITPYLSGSNYSLEAGNMPSNDRSEPQVMLPPSYIQLLGFENAEKAIGKTLKIGITNGLGQQSEVMALIVGVQERSLAAGSTLYVNDQLMSNVRQASSVGLPPQATSAFQIATARFDPNLSDEQIKDLKSKLRDAGYNATTIEDQIGLFKSVIAGIVMVLNGFAVIALIAASFGIINTLLMSVQERTKEIGLMKAMGMSGSKIFLLFSGEAVMLGFWGSLIGSIAAIGSGQVINHLVQTSFLKDLEGLRLLSFSPTSVAVIIGIVMAIAFFAGTLPAIRAARQNPIDSLRYE